MSCLWWGYKCCDFFLALAMVFLTCRLWLSKLPCGEVYIVWNWDGILPTASGELRLKLSSNLVIDSDSIQKIENFSLTALEELSFTNDHWTGKEIFPLLNLQMKPQSLLIFCLQPHGKPWSRGPREVVAEFLIHRNSEIIWLVLSLNLW